MTNERLHSQIQDILGQVPSRITPLSGGMIGAVYRVWFEDGRSIVAKVAEQSAAYLDIEGYMLQYLAEQTQLPAPDVLHSSDTLLLMTFIEGRSAFNTATEQHAAELLAGLHNITWDNFGLERNTLIGPLHQPNPPTKSWIEFFREQRLLYMSKVALDVGRLPKNIHARIEKFATQLEQWLIEPEQPSLIHGDIWTTNVLASNGRITAFIDPAIYYAHNEMELAYINLFNTFGETFFKRYHDLRPLEPGFFEERTHIYTLYPLLVHVRIFGGGYVNSVDGILRRFGY
ncbi:MAG: fructosamine kinase [Phototrophicales bacterium]|nr:MAG: fructosamine kinase [Phototrophicales bacterium]